MKMNHMKVLLRRFIVLVTVSCFIGGEFFLMPHVAKAENPIIQTTYTADPAPLVVGDTVYLYTTRDERRETKSTEWSLMNEWRCYSSKDMVNWTDLGQIAHANTFDGTNNWRAWAPQCVMRSVYEDGKWKDKYFLYAPFNGTKIDVAVADNPWGPFKDATPGKYLIDGGWGGGNIDPTVMIDDHGHPEDKANYDAYLYWGNPYFRYCKLTDDMLDVDPDTNGDGKISDTEAVADPRFSSEDNKILGKVRSGLHSFQTYGEEGLASFGIPTQGSNSTGKFPNDPKGSEKPRSAFEEGPWVYKHADNNASTDDYFLVFVGGRTPGETLEYSTAPTPFGPWTHRGLIMARELGFSCDHPGVASFKGHEYLFYLNEMLVGGTGSDRSVCVKEFEYDGNNLIKKQTPEGVTSLMTMEIKNSKKGTSYFSVNPVGTLDPYSNNQAETICWESNLNGPTGGFNGTGAGVKTKAKEDYKDKDPATGKVAFWQSAARNGVVVCDIDNNDYIKLRQVDFGTKGPGKFTASVACGQDTKGGDLEIWSDYDNVDSRKKLGVLHVSDTGGDNSYVENTIDISESLKGIHDLFFIFKGKDDVDLFNFDRWKFTEKDLSVVTTPTTATVTPITVTPEPKATPTAVPQETKQKYPTPKTVKAIQTEIKTVQIKWNKVTKAVLYKVYRSQSAKNGFKKIADVSVNYYNDRNVKPGKTYYYKVAVEDSDKAIHSDLSTMAVQTVFKKPLIKSLISTGGKLKINCQKIKNVKGYEVYIAAQNSGNYKLQDVITNNQANISIKNLQEGKRYYIKIRAYQIVNGNKSYSMYSNVKMIML